MLYKKKKRIQELWQFIKLIYSHIYVYYSGLILQEKITRNSKPAGK
jgi:hypothetical protein